MDKEDIMEMAAGILLVVFGLLYAMQGTLPEALLGGLFRWVKVLIALILLGVTAFRLLATFPDRRKMWMLTQSIAFAYLVLRLITIGREGFSGAAVVTFLTADALYLLALTALTVDGDIVRKLLFPAFLILQMVLEILEIFGTIMTRFAPEGEVGQFIIRHSFLGDGGEGSVLYRDPALMGIMAGFSIVVMLLLSAEDDDFLNRVMGGIYCLLSFAVVLKSHNRTVYIALGLALAAFILVRVLGLLGDRIVVFAVLLVTILLTGASLRAAGTGFSLTLLCRILFAAVLAVRVWHADSLSEGRWFPAVIYSFVAGGLDLSGTPDTLPLMLFVFLILAAGPEEGNRNDSQRMGAYFTGLKGWN